MNRLLRMTTIIACVVLFLGTWSTIAAQGQKKVKKSGGGAVTISGCLQRGPDANSYVLANVAGGPYELIGAPASVNFAPHVGHRIEVTGKNITKPNKAAKIEGEKGSAKKEERGERHLEVQSMKMVSPRCT